jgi:GTP-binding protein
MKKYIFDKARFLGSFDSPDKLSFAHAEVAFVGRSNAGKSSLINALCGAPIAKVSKTPGKTRMINVFSVAVDKWLVDLPGYGFAKASQHEKIDWKKMIEQYFFTRRSLKAILLVIDAYVGATALDLQMLDWLKRSRMPYRVIANKADHLSQDDRAKQRRSLALDLGVDPKHLLWTSAKKNTHIVEFHAMISGLLAMK